MYWERYDPFLNYTLISPFPPAGEQTKEVAYDRQGSIQIFLHRLFGQRNYTSVRACQNAGATERPDNFSAFAEELALQFWLPINKQRNRFY